MFSKKKKKSAQVGINVRARVFNAGLLARSQFASGRSCDRSARSRFPVVFHGSRSNVEFVPKFHVALHASHAALKTVILKISPYYIPPNVGLKFSNTALLKPRGFYTKIY
jgi:hypothetical protein